MYLFIVIITTPVIEQGLLQNYTSIQWGNKYPKIKK